MGYVVAPTITLNYRIGTTQKLAQDSYDRIDAKIKPLVDVMNKTGVIETIASCEGHGRLGKPPYIYFKSPVPIAAAIEKSIRVGKTSAGQRLHKSWIIEGHFNSHYELAFRLYAPEYHEMAFSIAAFVYFGVYRRHLDDDLLSLERLIRELLPELRETDEP